jgi:excisionase family DNA binding protein
VPVLVRKEDILMSDNSHSKPYNVRLKDFPDILNVDQLCEVLGISTKTGYKLLSNGTIAALKVGRMYRIPKVHVLTYLRILNTASKV